MDSQFETAAECIGEALDAFFAVGFTFSEVEELHPQLLASYLDACPTCERAFPKRISKHIETGRKVDA